MNPRTPVLVGVAAVQEHLDDHTASAEPTALMASALQAAGEDAGSAALLRDADLIFAPRGFWDYLDPCREVANRIGARDARTCVAELGVLQTTLFARAAEAIADGSAGIALITGGEAKYRALRAQIAGGVAELTTTSNDAPDEVLEPEHDIISEAEIELGIAMPVSQYAMMDNALRAADGQSLDEHRRDVADLWAAMSRVAVDNPAAWTRDALSADAIREPVGKNRMLAWPYTKLHNSQWNVNQAAGLILCSVEKAEALGIPRDRWVFPLAVADSNHMEPMTERELPHRSFGFAHAGRAALDRAGIHISGVDHFELYSCFPVAVRIQQRELAVPDSKPVTLTGGMAFAGGPLNNFVLQAQVRMAEVLRSHPGSIGMTNAISGMITKQGVSLWSTESHCPFGFDDVTQAAAADSVHRPLAKGATGEGTIVTYTVLFDRGEPHQGVAVCDLDDGRRTLVRSDDRELAREMTTAEFCGRRVRVGEASLDVL